MASISKPQTLLLLLLATLTVALLLSDAVSATAGGRNDKIDGVMSWQVIDRPEQDPNLQELAQYAVAAHNALSKSNLKYVKVVSCKHHDAAAGIIDKIVIETVEGGVKKTCEANVWVKPWIKYKKLISFQVLV